MYFQFLYVDLIKIFITLKSWLSLKKQENFKSNFIKPLRMIIYSSITIYKFVMKKI